MINVDLDTGEFKDNIKIKSEIAQRKLLSPSVAILIDRATHNLIIPCSF